MTQLTFAQLRIANVKRCAKWHPQGIGEWSLSDWAVATAGELGEACDVVKKLNRARDNLVGNSKSVEELRQQLEEELADTLIYLDLWAARAGIDLGKATIRKFNKVSERNGFPDRLGVETTE